MKRVAAAVIALVLLGSAGLAAVLSAGSLRAVYSVAEVRAGLAHDPRAWVGQTVLVRGVVRGSLFPLRWLPLAGSPSVVLRIRRLPVAVSPPPAASIRLVRVLVPLPSLTPGGVLVDAGTSVTAQGLPLAFAPQDQVLAFWRRLPWIGRFAPRPQSLSWQWDRPAAYRVRIQVAPAGTCGRSTCYEALLLDSAPSGWLPVAGSGLAPVMMRLPVPVTLIRLSGPVRLQRLRPLLVATLPHASSAVPRSAP